MTGEFNFNKFSKFLKSFWGILASFTVILPTVIYFLSTAQIKSSVLSEYYIGIPTTFSLLTIPFIFLFEDKFSVLSLARKVSILLAILSLSLLFTFLITKNIYITDTSYSKPGKNGYGRVEIDESKDGKIQIKTFDSSSSNIPIKWENRTNALELISLVFYTLSIILLTASFSSLGVFFYSRAG